MWLIETTIWLEECCYVMDTRQDIAHDSDGQGKAKWENHEAEPAGKAAQVREG
jgi:hypothetical protein